MLSKELSCGMVLPPSHLFTCESCAAASCIHAADNNIMIEPPPHHCLLAGNQLSITT